MFSDPARRRFTGDQNPTGAHPTVQTPAEILIQAAVLTAGQNDVGVTVQRRARHLAHVNHGDRDVHLVVQKVPVLACVVRGNASPGGEKHFRLFHIAQREAAEIGAASGDSGGGCVHGDGILARGADHQVVDRIRVKLLPGDRHYDRAAPGLHIARACAHGGFVRNNPGAQARVEHAVERARRVIAVPLQHVDIGAALRGWRCRIKALNQITCKIG